MDTLDVFKISGAVLGSVGGAAAIILALSSWLGKVWASRILEKEKQAYALELENVRNQMKSNADKQQLIFALYFEGQFKLYNELWLSLSKLKSGVDQLWEEANTQNLRSFIQTLNRAKVKIRDSALLIDPVHYQEIMRVITNFEQFREGKEQLHDTRTNIESLSQNEISQIINQNRENRDRINTFVEHMLDEMRRKIREG